MAESSWERLRQRLKELTPRNWGQSFDECIQRVNVYLRGWLGYFATSRSATGSITLEWTVSTVISAVACALFC